MQFLVRCRLSSNRSALLLGEHDASDLKVS